MALKNGTTLSITVPDAPGGKDLNAGVSSTDGLLEKVADI